MIVSIFNDVIGSAMRGPSSSHCAVALRIGRRRWSAWPTGRGRNPTRTLR